MKPKIHRSFLPAAAFLTLAPAASLLAADYTWTGATDSVSTTAANWNVSGSPAGTAPGTADNLLIDISTPNPTNIPSGNWERRGTGTTTINGTGIVNLITGSARFLNNGSFTLGGSGQFNHNGEYFIVANAANGGTTGNFIQNGGTLNSTHKRGFFISDGASCLGSTYTLSAGTMTVNSPANYDIGTTSTASNRKLRSVWFGKGGESTAASNVVGDTFTVSGGTATFTKSIATGTGTCDVMLSRNSAILVNGGTVGFDKYDEFRIGYGYGGTDPNYGTTASGTPDTKIKVTNGALSITGNTNVKVGFADPGTIELTGGTLDITGYMNVGTAATTGTVTMSGGALTITAPTTTAVDLIGSGANANATVSLSGSSILNAGNTKWKTGDFGGTGNAGTTTISLSGSSALTLKEFTIGHIGGAAATENVTVSGTSNLTVNNFITIGRDDNTTNGSMGVHLNLNGGTLSTSSIRSGGGTPGSTNNNIVANGGTIKALADESDFLRIGVNGTTSLNTARPYVKIESGGLTFNTNGHNIGIQTGLHAGDTSGGSLTKIGSGTLSLSGTSDYTGATNVNNGTLQLVPNGSLAGACNVAAGATLAVSGNTTGFWSLPDLNFAAGSSFTVSNLDPQVFSGPVVSVTNAVTPAGSVTVNVSGVFTPGDYPLIGYGSLGGGGFSSFQLGSLPRGTSASLTNSGSAVVLHVGTANPLIWKGNTDSAWDINTTTNWTLGGNPDKYIENDNVVFDDSATSSTVSLNTTVAPATVKFDNTSKDYTLEGTGGITGTTALFKTGSGSLTLTTANTHTGDTTVDLGTLNFGDGTTNGSITGPLVNYSNVVFNPAGSSSLSCAVSGSGAFGGSMAKTGTGTQILTGANTYSGSFNITGGTLQIGNGTVNGSFGTTTVYNVDPGTTLALNYATAATPAWSNVTGAGRLVLNSAQSVSGTANWGTLTLSPSFTGTLRVEKGRAGCDSGSAALGGAAKVEILSGSQLLCFNSATPYTTPIEIAGTGWGEAGYPGALRLAAAGAPSATWAGSITLTADSGIMAQRTSSFTITGPITGAYQCEFYAGDPVGDSGTLTIAPATAVQNSYASTKINGRPNASVVAGNAYAFSSGPLEVAGAILKLNGNSLTFTSLSGAGGAIGNYSSTTPVALTVGDGSSTTYAGVIRDGDAASLALVKTGAGTLALTGANTYTGNTSVNAGVLSVSSAYLADTSTVSIASGAKIDLPNAGSDTIAHLILGGVEVPPGTYNSTHPTYGSYFTGTGSLVIVGGYSSWAQTAGLDGTNNGLTQDADNDGISNLTEFYLNGNPLASDPSILPAGTLDTTYLTFTFSRRDDAEADVTSQNLQYGSNLAGWTNVPLGATSAAADGNGVIVTVSENGTNPDTITVRIPRALAPSGKLFGRLQVTK